MSQIPSQAPKALLFGAILKIHTTWTTAVNEIVPDPYLDEVFHVPQAQKYWAGDYFAWDPKITTPPGLYLFSNLVNSVWKGIYGDPEQSTEDLRNVNAMLFWVFLLTLRVFNSVGPKRPDKYDVLYREVNVVMFPLFFFFSGLYYTDLFSAWTVMVTYMFWSLSVDSNSETTWIWKVMHLVSGLVSLGSRQTNIFWVAVFLGGLQAVESLRRLRIQLHDPQVGTAAIEDYFKCIHSILMASTRCIPTLLIDLLPQLSLMGCFAAFVLWNGGVVLGDKDNHIAGIHIPQMLYIWPFMLFFSWPVVLPQVVDWKTLQKRLPRPVTAVVIMALMAAAVYFNTIVHPFTLADNRHYMFYVFRLLTRNPAIKFVVVPVYFICAWLVLGAFGDTLSPQKTEEGKAIHEPVRVSFVLIWLVSTALSLITAPLVEPRYFIVPWLLWRLHLPYRVNQQASKASEVPSKATKEKEKKKKPEPAMQLSQIPQLVAKHFLWIELAWFLLINYVTCWMFLYQGFEWKQEPGKVQRFMW